MIIFLSIDKRVEGNISKQSKGKYLRLSGAEDNLPISFPSLGLPLLAETPSRADKILFIIRYTFIMVLFLFKKRNMLGQTLSSHALMHAPPAF